MGTFVALASQLVTHHGAHSGVWIFLFCHHLVSCVYVYVCVCGCLCVFLCVCVSARVVDIEEVERVGPPQEHISQ